jgi:hypothetical protein
VKVLAAPLFRGVFAMLVQLLDRDDSSVKSQEKPPCAGAITIDYQVCREKVLCDSW